MFNFITSHIFAVLSEDGNIDISLSFDKLLQDTHEIIVDASKNRDLVLGIDEMESTDQTDAQTDCPCDPQVTTDGTLESVATSLDTVAQISHCKLFDRIS
jgi:hypothetical protein